MAKFYGALTDEVSQIEIESKTKVRKLAGECTVLLENNGVLPLQGIKKIALYGPGARKTVKGGTGSGDVNSRDTVNIEQGLEDAGFEVVSKSWLDEYDQIVVDEMKAYKERCAKIAEEQGLPVFAIEFSQHFNIPAPQDITVKEDTDTAIYVISRDSGEGGDRKAEENDYFLSQAEKTAIASVAAKYEKTIILLNIGGVLDLTELKKIDGIDAILLAGQLGNIGGYAIADVLTGKVTPSGKLTDTWAVKYEDYPSSANFGINDGDPNDSDYTEGIFVGYRYFDSFHITPNYCFGYGISYTDFSIETTAVLADEKEISVTVKVTNTGTKYAGKEVVQVYYSAPAGKLEKPYQELAAFDKTKTLLPGESETMVIRFATKDMASYSEAEAAWILEPGKYFIRVGNSSRSTKVVGAVEIKEEKKTEILKNLFPLDREIELLSNAGVTPYGYPEEADEKNAAPVFTLDSEKIETVTASYTEEHEEFTTDKTEKITMEDVLAGKATLQEMIAQLTVEEMAELCVGTSRGTSVLGEDNIIGNSSNAVPGAAGDTSSILIDDRKVKNLILADGPAGLRLQPHYKTTKDGQLLPGGAGMGGEFEPFDMSKIPEDAIDYYQYCTAVPIGMSLAQSWDMDMLEKVGKIVGNEMKAFHVDLWLAPAMNIHRNPLCGRNFEYYSEDPVVAGKCAAAITNGVQSDPTIGTTIKHFAANSQEENRYFTNSHMTERTIREIYIKNFEITVKESKPLSIMTSYNLINGIHAANSYDLLQAAARDEWGFDGVVMTDWFTSVDMPALTGVYKPIYPISASTGCIKAGNDLQMPGCQKNIDDILDSVKNQKEIDGYTLTKADLQFCVENLFRVIARTEGAE